jgi:2-methylisocitrate lyase-like PEP mutase family enzyme
VGAEVVFAPALKDLNAIKEVCSAVTCPVNVVMEQGENSFSVQQLSDAGIKRISVGGAPAQLAYGSLVRAGREMIDSGTFTFTQDAMDYYELEGFFKSNNSETDD